MAKFILQPCKLREEWLVPTKDPAIRLSWSELCAKLAPSRDERALKSLQLLQIGAFVGLSSRAGKPPSNFVLLNPDRSGNLKQVLKGDPTFASRLLEVYLVEEARWDSKVVERRSRP